jgi:hypothetical protein
MVDQLHNVSARLEGLAELNPPVPEALITIAGNVRGTALSWQVLVATKRPSRSEGRQIRVIRNRSTLDRLVLQACLRFIRRSIP